MEPEEEARAQDRPRDAEADARKEGARGVAGARVADMVDVRAEEGPERARGSARGARRPPRTERASVEISKRRGKIRNDFTLGRFPGANSRDSRNDRLFMLIYISTVYDSPLRPVGTAGANFFSQPPAEEPILFDAEGVVARDLLGGVQPPLSRELPRRNEGQRGHSLSLIHI